VINNTEPGMFLVGDLLELVEGFVAEGRRNDV